MGDKLILIAPRGEMPSFGSIVVDPNRWNTLRKKASRLRANEYLKDEAIRDEDIDSDGCFTLPIDDSSWHLLILNDEDEAMATMRLTDQPLDPGKRKGWIPHIHDSFKRVSKQSVLPHLVLERSLAVMDLKTGIDRNKFMIVGGWAANSELGSGQAGAEIALTVWAFIRFTNAAGALCMATERHDAFNQLSRIGCRPLKTVGPDTLYFDPSYGCRVGILCGTVYEEFLPYQRIVNRLERRIGRSEVVVSN